MYLLFNLVGYLLVVARAIVLLFEGGTNMAIDDNWTDQCLDVISNEDGSMPDRFSTAELLVYLAAQVSNNRCPYCGSMDEIKRIGEFVDRFKCSVCEHRWEQAYRLILSPLLLNGLSYL